MPFSSCETLIIIYLSENQLPSERVAVKIHELIHAKYRTRSEWGKHSLLAVTVNVIIIPAELCLMFQPLSQPPSLFLPTWTIPVAGRGTFKGPRVSSCLTLGNGLPEEVHVRQSERLYWKGCPGGEQEGKGTQENCSM